MGGMIKQNWGQLQDMFVPAKLPLSMQDKAAGLRDNVL